MVEAAREWQQCERSTGRRAFSGSTVSLCVSGRGQHSRGVLLRAFSGADAVGHQPTAPEVLYKLADAHQALSFLASLWVLHTGPESYRAHELRGEALEAAGKTDEAIVEYRRALEIKPELQTVHFTIGNIYWRLGQMDEALVELAEELKINPNDPQAHYESGDILLSQNKPDEAEKHFIHALRFSPGLTEAHLAMERILSARGDTAAAIVHLRKAAELTPDSSTPHYRLWMLYRKLGRTDDAKRERTIFDKLKALERKYRRRYSGACSTITADSAGTSIRTSPGSAPDFCTSEPRVRRER